MLEKYYLSDNPMSKPRADGIKVLGKAEDLINLKNALVYCDSGKIIKRVRELDAEGKLHLGCRGISAPLMYKAKVLRFQSNYLISSNKWKDEKYETFLNFVPKPELKLCTPHYLNITDYSDEDAARIFNEQMATLDSGIKGIDFETNDFPEENGHFPLGLSIVDKVNGYYYDFEDYPTTKFTYPKFFNALLDYVSKHCFELYAFNVSFEIRVFYNMYHRFIKLQDTRAWCIIDAMKSNLKYGAQYYLEVASWDDDVDIEHKLLKKSFEIPLDEFLYEYKLGENSKYDVVRQLYKRNKDNPKFITRYQKYHGKVWACGNQFECGKYCCYDSVMDIHIYEAIRKIKHVDHYYNDECYYVYIYNQYLSAIIELSGINVDWKLLMDQKDAYDKIIFNSNLYINKELMKYKIEKLEKQSNIELDLNEKLRYIVEDLSSKFFVQGDYVKLGKEFAAKVRKNPDAYNKIVTIYNDELQYIITTWSDDATFKAASRKRKQFEDIGKKLYKELDLPDFFEQFNRKYLELSHCNEKALKYWSGTEDELKELMNKGPDAWKAQVPKEFHDMIKLYIWDFRMCRYADKIKDALELRKLRPQYERAKEACKGRTLFTPVDKSLSKYFLWEMNSPDDKKMASELVQSYYEVNVAYFRAFRGLTKNLNKPELFTKEQYLKYYNQMNSKFGEEIINVPEFYDYFWKPVEVMETKLIPDKVKGGDAKRKIKVGTGEFNDVRLKWSLKGNPRIGSHLPWSIAPTTRMAQFDRDPKEINNYSIDEEFDIRIFNLHKFLGMFKLNRVAVKEYSTSISAVLDDSRYVKVIDSSRGQRCKRKVTKDEMNEVRFYTKTHANACRTGRWKSNIHSVFPASEDTRVPLICKIGTHFILPRDDKKEYTNTSEIITVDGMNFRHDDTVYVKGCIPKLACELNESDVFDSDWLNKIKEDDAKSDVNWDVANQR